MARPVPDPAKHELRAWFKQALRSDLFGKLPPRGPGGRPPEATARRLLAELLNPPASDRPLASILAEARSFRSWTQSSQHFARRRILAQIDGEIRAREARADVTRPPADPAVAVEAKDDGPGDHPLWDRWLDGYLT